MCDSIGCLVESKPNVFPTICNASNYTKLKKDRILYHQYTTANPTLVVCDATPTATYKSYDMRQNILWGCAYNKRVCLKKC